MYEVKDLTEQIQHYIQGGDADFNALACQVFAYQYQYCQPYQAYCRQVNKTPAQVQTWRQVPAVSTEVFREFNLSTLPVATAQYVFYTSGTSQETRGKHYYYDMRLYHATIANSFMQGLQLLPQNKVSFRILTPSFLDNPHSSLFYMFQKALMWYGDEHSTFYFKDNVLDCARLLQDLLADIAAVRPVVLLGTAFSFVNFMDYLQQEKIVLSLPSGSRLLETGGLKGRARCVSRYALYQLLMMQLGLSPQLCFSEYGMTELSSQCYSQPNSHIFIAPRWMPVCIIDPQSGQEVALGESGLVQCFDLANYTTVSAIITSDIAVRHAQGFELVGRAPKAVLRGCSTVMEV